MRKQLDTEVFIRILIVNNCSDCKHFREDLNVSPCLCEPVYDMLVDESGIYESDYCTEWETQRKQALENL